MTRRVRTTYDPTILAVADAPGASDGRLTFWRLGPEGPRFDRVVTGAASTITSTIDGSLAGRLIFILPSGQVRCRVCELPDAGNEQLAMALRLQAESAQLGSIPAHRTATAVVPNRPGASRCGVIIEWPTSEAAPAVPGALIARRSPTYGGDVSSLAGLASVSDVRGPLLELDVAHGIVAFAIVTPKGVAVRSAREDLSEDPAGVVTRLLLETALHHGMDGPALERIAIDAREATAAAGAAGFGCIADDRARLAHAAGAPTDAEWWRANGLHAGMAIVSVGPLAALAGLNAHEPGEEPDLLGRAINHVSSPEALGWAVIAAVIAIAFGPLAIAWADYWIMRWKVSEVGADKLRLVVAENDKLLALYKERSQRTWPITKILGDLACCTPEGIDFEQVNIVQGDSVSVRGQARRNDQLSAPEVILRMETLLRESRVFSKINKSWEQPNQMGISQFNLSANVSAPTRQITPAEGQNWSAVTLAERKYPSLRRPSESASPDGARAANSGSGASGAPSANGAHGATGASGIGGAVVAPPADGGTGGTHVATAEDLTGSSARGTIDLASAPTEAPSARAAVDGERRAPPSAGGEAARRGLALTGDPGSGERTGRSGPAAVNPDVPPDPLTEEQIGAMSKEEALAAASSVAKARNNKSFSDDVQSRLKDEFYKLMARVRAASAERS